MGMDMEEYKSNGLLFQLTGVTVVLDGHTHKVYTKEQLLSLFTQYLSQNKSH